MPPTVMDNEDPLGLMISIELTYWSLGNYSLENITYWQPQSHSELLKNKDKDVTHLHAPIGPSCLTCPPRMFNYPLFKPLFSWMGSN